MTETKKPAPRCYTTGEIMAALKMSRTNFQRLKREGKLPFLEELRPRIGRPRYRADLVDRYLAGEWDRPQFFFGRRSYR